jgi:drug/metabolite transporter (DMT)-like permease
MTHIIILLWISNIVLDTVGQLSFKVAALKPHSEATKLSYWASVFQQPWLWIGVVCYVVEFVVWIAFLSLVPLSQGVLLGSINIVVILIAGRYFFAEKLTTMRVIGVMLIICGVALVGLTP